jgi:hypothetical protein
MKICILSYFLQNVFTDMSQYQIPKRDKIGSIVMGAVTIGLCVFLGLALSGMFP